MTEQDVQAEDDDAAERAFVALRAEVAAARRVVEGLPALIEGLAAPDYAPSFGALAKDLVTVEKRLAGIEAHPTVQLTPEHVRAIVAAGVHSIQTAILKSHAEAVALGENKAREAALAQKQGRGRWWVAAGCVAAGFVLFPLVAAFVPGGSHLAALAAGHTDRWEAGGVLMQAANPTGWNDLAGSWTLTQANVPELKACRDLVARAGKKELCVITVPAP